MGDGLHPLRWTSTKPTQPGFYWNQGYGTRKRIFEIRDDGRLRIAQTGKLLSDVAEDEYRWAGPIPETLEP